MKPKTLQILLLSLLLPLLSFKADEVKEGDLKWLSFEEAVRLNEKAPKKILIDVYTDWCGWCKKMDKATYTNPEIIKSINKDFYLVKLNAESKDKIVFKDKTFQFNAEYKSHELALGLLRGQMSYPSTVFMDEGYNLLTVVPGYLTPENMQPILNYFGADVYKSKSWEEYQQETKK
jgi:thioredoxin-related protein